MILLAAALLIIFGILGLVDVVGLDVVSIVAIIGGALIVLADGSWRRISR